MIKNNLKKIKPKEIKCKINNKDINLKENFTLRNKIKNNTKINL